MTFLKELKIIKDSKGRRTRGDARGEREGTIREHEIFQQC